jgi:hypothetical protein
MPVNKMANATLMHKPDECLLKKHTKAIAYIKTAMKIVMT